MQLIYLSPVPWDSFAQRPHKFVEWFHGRTGGLVLWLDPYPTRFPSWKDFQISRSSVVPRQFSSTPSWLTVLKPGGLPIEPIPGSGWVNSQWWRSYLNLANEFSRNSKTLLSIGKPSVFALELLKLLRHCPSLYDAMDDFPAFYSGFSRFALAQREIKIARQVDIIWVSSSQLKSRWEFMHNNVCLVRNGLDLSAMPVVDSNLLSMSSSCEKKIFGYIGTIASWFDWDCVATLAKARPDDEIRLIGPVFEQLLGRLPSNVQLLPACDHATALKFMMEFHVGLIPFKKNVLTASVDPIKYYEYRALGLPVISTAFGEMRLRSNERGVFISQSQIDLPVLANSAVKFEQDADEANKFALKNSWEFRFESAKLFPD